VAHWHPPIDDALNIGQWRAHYERWRDIHGPASPRTQHLRRLIGQVTRSDRLSALQRNELLSVIVQIDDEARGR
jgi:hypothetical protein